MRNSFLLFFVLLPACGVLDAQQRTQQMQACQNSATNPDRAMSACTRLLGDHSLSEQERVVVYFWRAQAAYQKQDLPGALRDLDESIRLDSTKAASYGLRGVVHGTQGDLRAAIRDFTRAVELDPTLSESFQNRGKAYSDSGDQERAIEDYDRVIALGADGPIPRNGRCWSLAILNRDLDEAMKDCNEAIRLMPEDGNQFNSRAFLRYQGGDYAGAVADYTASLALNPGSGSSHYMRGRAKAKLGDPTASQDIDEGIEIEAGVAERYASYGVTP